ncbi:hypothetical protein An03g05800 [Aspergillus niger]|uniref:Uncharacterized protein n=2 Tax=Aspergillus niger TaxID=5061 RepID=A2QH70_ASPNC|nr:hypothetical protein An03g05800 [Aspergillus niger]CAK38340.1 hypothetical protein An03g05800 [Aspergillus niger]
MEGQGGNDYPEGGAWPLVTQRGGKVPTEGSRSSLDAYSYLVELQGTFQKAEHTGKGSCWGIYW